MIRNPWFASIIHVRSCTTLCRPATLHPLLQRFAILPYSPAPLFRRASVAASSVPISTGRAQGDTLLAEICHVFLTFLFCFLVSQKTKATTNSPSHVGNKYLRTIPKLANCGHSKKVARGVEAADSRAQTNVRIVKARGWGGSTQGKVCRNLSSIDLASLHCWGRSMLGLRRSHCVSQRRC